MKSVLLDTSFILTCVRQKIDFFEEIPLMGYEIIIPKQVLVEIEGLSKNKEEALLAIKLIKANKFSELDIKSKKTDEAIINYAKKNSSLVVATLDRGIKKSVKNMLMVIRGKKKLEIL